MCGLGLFAFTIWIRVEPGFQEWIDILNIYAYYIGVYILLALAVFVLIVSFLGCCAALVEHGLGLLVVSIHLCTNIWAPHGINCWYLNDTVTFLQNSTDQENISSLSLPCQSELIWKIFLNYMWQPVWKTTFSQFVHHPLFI